MRRADRVAQVQELRAKGLTIREITIVTGLSRSWVTALLYDPTGEKVRARKDRYRGRCEVCGAKTDGSNGLTGQPKRCLSCTNKTRERIWTRERCIDALRDFHDEHGRTPTAGEHGSGPYWHQSVGWLPSLPTLDSIFGSRAAAYDAAGLPAPRRTGRPVGGAL